MALGDGDSGIKGMLFSSGRFSRERKRPLTCVEEGVMERWAPFWIGLCQGLYHFKLGKVIILLLVLHFANPTSPRSYSNFHWSVSTKIL